MVYARMSSAFHEERRPERRCTRRVKSDIHRRAAELIKIVYARYVRAMLEQLETGALKPDQVERWEPDARQ